MYQEPGLTNPEQRRAKNRITALYNVDAPTDLDGIGQAKWDRACDTARTVDEAVFYVCAVHESHNQQIAHQIDWYINPRIPVDSDDVNYREPDILVKVRSLPIAWFELGHSANIDPKRAWELASALGIGVIPVPKESKAKNLRVLAEEAVTMIHAYGWAD